MKSPLASMMLAFSLAFGASSVNADMVSVSVGQPGFYGRIDIGGYAPPQLVYSQPMLAHPGHYGGAPVYVHARPKHIKHWHKHCHRYGACGTPVYFVQDHWYNTVYVPQQRGHHHGQKHKHKHQHKHEYKHHDHGSPHHKHRHRD